ncbi:MAG TPA: hypothetical protein EYO22_06350 [Candidatus Poseidoniales archaeon]|nr:hypothetical protein [Candidatus Poseidoniales archaeon]
MNFSEVCKKFSATPRWQKRFALSVLLIFDAYLGLTHHKGMIAWSNLFVGDLVWILQSTEMMAGGLLVIHTMFNETSGNWRMASLASSPVMLLALIFVTLQLLITGLGFSSTINYNFSSVGLSGLYWAAAYLCIAVGLTLTYKVQRYGNFAQGEMMLVGSYIAITMMWSERFFEMSDAPKDDILQWDLLIYASVAAFFLVGILGVLIDKLVYRRFRKKEASPQVMMIASLGVAMILRALMYLRYTARTFRFVPDRDWKLATSRFQVNTERLQIHLGERGDSPLWEFAENVTDYGFSYTKAALIVGVFSSVLLLLFIMHKTRLGKQMRAVADNPDLAASSGINVERIHSTSAFLSAGLSGLGGALLAAILPINPELGLSLLLPAFAVIVLGTIGSIQGVLIGSLIVGFVRSASEPILIGAGNTLNRPTATGFAEVMPFIFLVAVLLLMPKGIGEAMENWNIERLRKRQKKEEMGVLRLRDRFPPLAYTMKATAKVSAVGGVVVSKFDPIIKFKTSTLESVDNLLSSLVVKVGAGKKKLLSFPKSWLQKLPIQVKDIRERVDKHLPYGREGLRGSWLTFVLIFLVLVYIAWGLPSVTSFTKTMQIARLIALVAIFSLMAFSLNLHTGVTGMTNFGVIFFVGIGAITVGLLCAPVETNGYGWQPWKATLMAIFLAGAAGWLLAYPTARLRMDYFAIVTISLGEMLRISLQAEPLLRAGTVTSAIGISQYTLPLEAWWDSGISDTVGGWLGFDQAAPYIVLLAVMATISVLAVWWLLDTMLASPWGRILRSIREDEEVSQHHGHDVLTHKAASLAVGGAIAGLAGALWAWLNTGIWPDFLNPVRSTFLVWAAFIVGGRGNNRGMVIGAFIIIITEFLFNVMVVARGDSSLAFHELVASIDQVFSWIVVDLGGYIWSDLSITTPFSSGNVIAELAYVKLGLLGLVILVSLLVAEKGLLPEVPSRPARPSSLTETEIIRDSGGEEE